MRSQFLRVHGLFSPTYIRVHVLSLSVQIAGSYIYICIYTYISSCWANGPRHLIPLSPEPAHASSILLSLLSVPSDRAFNGCFVFTCVQSVYTYTCRRSRSPFRLLAQIKLRDDDSIHERVVISIQHMHHVKQLMCCRSRSNEFLSFYHVFPFTCILQCSLMITS